MWYRIDGQYRYRDGSRSWVYGDVGLTVRVWPGEDPKKKALRRLRSLLKGAPDYVPVVRSIAWMVVDVKMA